MIESVVDSIYVHRVVNNNGNSHKYDNEYNKN